MGMHLSVGGQVGCSLRLAVSNAAARNTGIWVSASPIPLLLCVSPKVESGGLSCNLARPATMTAFHLLLKEKANPWLARCREVSVHLSDGLQGTESRWCHQLLSLRPLSSATVYFHGQPSFRFPSANTAGPRLPGQRPLWFLFL